MKLSAPDPATSVVILDGPVGKADAARLRDGLVAAVEAVAGDLVVDGRGITAFDDACLTAFTAARSRAKWLRSAVVVLSADDGPLTAALRRSGHLLRIPSYPDVDTALADLDRRRAARAGLALATAPSAAAGGMADPAGGRTDRDGRPNPYRHVVE